jgi:hypothetical protein
MRVKTTDEFAPCFKCGYMRRPLHGVRAYRAPDKVSRYDPEVMSEEQMIAEMGGFCFKVFAGLPFLVGDAFFQGTGWGPKGMDVGLSGAQEWLANPVTKAIKTVLTLGKDDTIREKKYRPKTIKHSKVTMGGALYLLMGTGKKWMCAGPAYEGQDRPSRLTKSARKYDWIFGIQHYTRRVKYVCWPCYKHLIGECPTPSPWKGSWKDYAK